MAFRPAGWSGWWSGGHRRDEQERGVAAVPSTGRAGPVFRERPLEGRYPYLWLDAKVERVREPGGVRQKALVIAYAVHETGRREVIGIDLGETETEAFWRDFLRGLRARGLSGVKLCVSDAHQGLKNAIGQVLGGAVAALHRPLPARHARPRPKDTAADGGRRHPPSVRRQLTRRGIGDPW
jgi:hypothetical protein